MKILLLSWKDIAHPQKGGAEVVMYNYAKRLMQQGHEVTWVGSGFNGGKYVENIEGINIVRIATISTIYFKIGGYYKKHLKGKFDIIIDEAGGPPLFSPLYEKQIPIVFFIHHISDIEWDFQYPFPLSKLGKLVYKNILKIYKSYPTITVSNSTKQELVDDFGFESNKVYAIENALDIDTKHNVDMTKKEKSILFFGRLMPLKRVEHAILAFEYFSKTHPEYILNIVGPYSSGKYINQLKKIVSQAGLENKIHFRGGISLEQREQISSNKVMLVPSYKEGYGLVVLEANVYGIPCIGYDVAGIRDSIKHGTNGYKVQDGDYIAMGEQLNQLVDNDKIYNKMIGKSYDHVNEHHSWDDNSKKLETILKKLCN